jgi:hypothetical protein
MYIKIKIPLGEITVLFVTKDKFFVIKERKVCQHINLIRQVSYFIFMANQIKRYIL